MARRQPEKPSCCGGERASGEVAAPEARQLGEEAARPVLRPGMVRAADPGSAHEFHAHYYDRVDQLAAGPESR